MVGWGGWFARGAVVLAGVGVGVVDFVCGGEGVGCGDRVDAILSAVASVH